MRAQAHKVLRRITKARKKEANGIDVLISACKEIRNQLMKEIAGSKKGAWAGFCEILERDP